MKVCPSGTYQLGKTKSFVVQGDLRNGKRNIYSVINFQKGWSCECFDWCKKSPSIQNYECKHIKAVKEYIEVKKNENENGNGKKTKNI